jgi:phosphoserine aminotransferase
VATAPDLRIPADLLPADGRFGSGPSKVRPEQVAALASVGTTLLGTSHRQRPVRALVGRVRAGLSALLGAPDDYEVVLGLGGSTVFWDVALACLVERRSAHGVFGDFGGKFATAAARAPFLADPQVTRVPAGSVTLPDVCDDADVYAWPHNETSTGAMAPVRRIAGTAGRDALVVIDATSGAGALPVDLTQADVYHFSPQKVFASDGGLWIALASPAAIERAARVEASGRWVPQSLSFTTALANSRQDQTLNTPALATLVLLAEQLDWILGNGGLDWAVERCRTSSGHLYSWAQARDFASPFVADEAARSLVVATIDLADGVEAATVSAVLRANGVVDVDPYRGLGRNQLRVGVFPAVEPDDVLALTSCVDWVVEHLV